MKILSFSTCFPNAREPAAGVFVRSRLEYLAALADVHVVAPISPVRYSSRSNPWTGTTGVPLRTRDGPLDVSHPRYFYLPLVGPFNALLIFLQMLAPVARLRREFSFQLIDAHFGYPEGIVAALLSIAFRCPFTVTLRGSEVEHAQNRLRRQAMGWALRRAIRVIAVSERLRQFALELGVDPARVVTISNGVDSAAFFPRDRAACRHKHGIPEGQRVVLSVGVLMELKGHHRVAAALARLREQSIEAHLLIAGGEARARNFEPEIRRQVAALRLEDNVHFLGHVGTQDLAELMAAADVLCLASSREGCPNVINEALSCGTPVVATDVGSVPQMLPSKQYGIVVPPGDVPELAAALGQALERRWDSEAIARWGRSRGWQQVAREVRDLMAAALVEAHGSREAAQTPALRE